MTAILPSELRPVFMSASAALIAPSSDGTVWLTCGRTVPACAVSAASRIARRSNTFAASSSAAPSEK